MPFAGLEAPGHSSPQSCKEVVLIKQMCVLIGIQESSTTQKYLNIYSYAAFPFIDGIFPCIHAVFELWVKKLSVF